MKRERMEKNKKMKQVLLLSCFMICLAVNRSWADLIADGPANVSTGVSSEPSPDVSQRETKTMDLLSRIDAFSETDKNLKLDSAKAHYNMGNIYFEKGEYDIAAREYYQAVTLMPDDPDAHYNLAFVSGEYLNDNETALKHYQLYLYLKPDAEDKAFVAEKIMHAQMVLDSKIDSSIDDTK